MASAAAVGVDAARSPPTDGNDIGEDSGIPGEITSAIGSRTELGLETAGNDAEEEDEEDEDIRGTARRRGPAVTADEGDAKQSDEEVAGGVDDLFGDDEHGDVADGAEKPTSRLLDDEDLDSGDDMDRTDRVGAEQEQEQPEQEYETQEKVTMDLEIARQALPEPSDGEMYLLKMPDFMAIEPSAWDHQKFQPPTTDHHSSKEASAIFSAYNTAMSTVRWRHSPSNPNNLQSNARILRWSDGSLTMQLASEPNVQYQIDGNPLAPPQRNPVKPTPVSVAAPGAKGGRQGDGTVPGERYDHQKDAFTYMVIPSESTSTLRVAHKITAGLSIRQSESVVDDAEERLQAALANAVNATKVNGVGSADLQLIDEDPEQARKAAEEAMRQKAKQDKKKDAAAQRDIERANRAMGRHGMASSRYGGGLNVGMLEDEDGMGGGGRPKKAGSGARKSRQRRNSIYSDDEDFGRKRFATKEDEYDEEDDFLAPSDEEEELVDEEDEDEDDGIIEEPRERTPKRDRPPPADAGEDADADGEPDDDLPQGPRSKKRRVVDDDDEE